MLQAKAASSAQTASSLARSALSASLWSGTFPTMNIASSRLRVITLLDWGTQVWAEVQAIRRFRQCHASRRNTRTNPDCNLTRSLRRLFILSPTVSRALRSSLAQPVLWEAACYSTDLHLGKTHRIALSRTQFAHTSSKNYCPISESSLNTSCSFKALCSSITSILYRYMHKKPRSSVLVFIASYFLSTPCLPLSGQTFCSVYPCGVHPVA
jgi:hypothetical protein